MSRRRWSLDVFSRPDEGRILGGVCVALSDRLGIDVTLVRLAFMVLTLAWGLGALLYGLLWFLLPEMGEDPDQPIKQRARRNLKSMRHDMQFSAQSVSARWARLESSSWPRPLGRRWIALGMLFLGLFILLATFGAFDWISPVRALGLAIILAGASILVSMRER